MNEYQVTSSLARELLDSQMGYEDGEMDWSDDDLANVRLFNLTNTDNLWLLVFVTPDNVWYRVFSSMTRKHPLPVALNHGSWNEDAGDFLWDNFHVEG